VESRLGRQLADSPGARNQATELIKRYTRTIIRYPREQ